MATLNPRFVPPTVTIDNVVACIGLIADTHMPERWAALPPAIFTIFQGVDLLLHVGDIGELWVLDQLSTIAPVVAVHGNDDTADAQRELPYQQLITVSSTRILLTHGHFQDATIEQMVLRRGQWAPMLTRHAERAQQAAAQIIISGHTHVPMTTTHHGIQFINPGAIASGTYKLRQDLQSVAILFLTRASTAHVTHIDIHSQQPFQPQVDFTAPFMVANARVCSSLLHPDLEGRWDEIKRLRACAPEEFHRAILRAAHPCWADTTKLMTNQNLWVELQHEATISPSVLRQFEAVLS